MTVSMRPNRSCFVISPSADSPPVRRPDFLRFAFMTLMATSIGRKPAASLVILLQFFKYFLSQCGHEEKSFSYQYLYLSKAVFPSKSLVN